MNSDDEILIAERIDVPDAWQFPQGGVDKGESVKEALVREMEEELGLKRKHYDIETRRDGYRYLFPGGRIKHGKYHGQEQTYFLCRFLGKEKNICLTNHKPEFSRWRWIEPADFRLKWAPEFKQVVFEEVFRDFFGVELGK